MVMRNFYDVPFLYAGSHVTCYTLCTQVALCFVYVYKCVRCGCLHRAFAAQEARSFPLPQTVATKCRGRALGCRFCQGCQLKRLPGGTTQDTGGLPEEAQFGGRLAGMLLKQKSLRNAPPL